MAFNNREVGNATNPHLNCHRAPPWFTNCQTMMTVEPKVRYNAPFEGALMGLSIVQYLPVKLPRWSLSLGFLDSSLRAEHKSKGKLNKHKTTIIKKKTSIY